MKKRILIIDNGTSALEDLKDALKKEDFIITNFRNFKPTQIEGFTHVILTGGGAWPTLKEFSEEAELIKNVKVPILGICLGLQIIGITFGSSLKHLDKEKIGNKEIKILEKDSLFKGLNKNFSGYAYHKYALNKIGEDLDILAESKDCVEAIKHKSLPIWGVQFHPEVISDGKKDGRKIITNFLNKK